MTEHPITNEQPRRSRRRKATVEEEIANDAIGGSPSDAEVVFIGPVGVGKTTAVQTLSSVPPINTEVMMFEGAEEFLHTSKTTTTVGIDYGMWVRPDGKVIGLFGTTGQDRFTDSRTPLLNPDAGIVIWLYGDSDTLGADLGSWITTAGGPTNSHRILIGVNYPTDEGLNEIKATLEQLELGHIRVTTADPRNIDDVRRVVNDVLQFNGV